MALDDLGFVVVCDLLHRSYPDDARVARLLIRGLETLGKRDQAARAALGMAKRFIALGLPSQAMGFLARAQALDADGKELDSLLQAARLTQDVESVGELHRFELIEPLSDEEAEAFLRKGTRRRVAPGTVIMKEGEVGHTFDLLLQGRCEVVVRVDGHNEIVRMLKAGDFFGEVACLFKLPRSASVIAHGDVELLEFLETVIEELAAQSPLASDYLHRVVERRLLHTMTYQVEGFRDLAETDREWLAEESSIVELAEGTRLPGHDLGEDLWVVVHGELNLVRRVNGALRILTWGQGKPFGHALERLGPPADAEILATERTLLARIPKRIATALFAAYPSVDEWMRASARHLQDTLA